METSDIVGQAYLVDGDFGKKICVFLYNMFAVSTVSLCVLSDNKVMAGRRQTLSHISPPVLTQVSCRSQNFENYEKYLRRKAHSQEHKWVFSL